MFFAGIKTAGLSLCAALLLCAGVAQGQFIGYVAQQTTVQSKTIAPGAPTPQTITAINNLGQAAHTLLVNYSIPDGKCTTWLQSSSNGVVWSTIASAPNFSAFNQFTTYATGYYPLLRVVANANNTAGCDSGIQWTYVGYQNPPGLISPIYSKSHVDIAAPVVVAATIEYPDPIIVEGFSCFNPNASTAYLQLSDDSIPPAAMPGDIIFQIGIPAGQTFTSSRPVYAASGLGAGASTTANGATPVATPLVCSFQLNFSGPFGSIIGFPNTP